MKASLKPGTFRIDPWPSESDWLSLEFVIRQATGLDLGAYKKEPLQCKICDLSVRYGYPDIPRLIKRLQIDAGFRDWFVDQLLNNVTEFFRDEEQWQYLNKALLPHLAQPQETMQAWCAGCSNGAEPLSLACLFEDYNLQYSILATDLDRRCLCQAEQGSYSKSEVTGMPQNYLNQFFEENEDGYGVQPNLLEKIEYRRANLLTDPVDRVFDLIICKNVLVYLSPLARDTVIQKLVASLKQDGILLLGTCEKLLNPHLMHLMPIRNDFYRKLGSE